MYKRISILLIIQAFVIVEALACTSAIIGADMNPYGRPLLWKHRDTSTIDNKVEYVAPENGSFGYVALFNASDKELQEAWTGMNEVGFAIMNTASYNIKDDNIPENEMDKEGFIMTMALKNCRTVDDFAQLLDTLPKPLGVEANFGVIDAYGDGAFFETNNYTFNRFNLSDAKNHVLLRTNYSHSGRPDEGFGFIREANANHLLKPYIEIRTITPEILTEEVSRSFWHSLMNKDMLSQGDEWIIDQDFIPRYKSTATIVIEGCKPIDKSQIPDKGMIKEEYIMWTGLGYPPCAEITPVWVSEAGVDDSLRGLEENGHSKLGDVAKARRDEVFPIHKDTGDKYIETKALVNENGTGYLQVLIPQNLEVYRKIREKRD